MTKTLHLLGLPYTQVNLKYSHCAFSQKILRFSKMMQAYGYKVYEYSNEGSESECLNKVPILSLEELQRLSDLHRIEFPNDILNTGSTLCKAFNAKVIGEMVSRVQPGDIVCHPFGPTHQMVTQAFPQAFHVEMGIGYNNPYLNFRIYESYTHWHYIMGKEGTQQGSDYNWVIPNYFDVDEWTQRHEAGEYLLMFGRVQEDKGLNIVKEIAKHTDLKVIVCGTMNIANELRDRISNNDDYNNHSYTLLDPAIPNLLYKAPVRGKERDELLGKALAILMPTRYMEPFGCSGVEGMLCGTPLISSDFGSFSETQPDSWYRCKTLKDYLNAIELAKTANRQKIAINARAKYCLQTVGEMYDKAFKQISNLNDKGWYTL